MGGSSWSKDLYENQSRARLSTRGTYFDYDADIKKGIVDAKVHASLDPKVLDVKVRESRDSTAHPESNAIVVALDVTGSMNSVIKAIHAKLPTLMGLLTRKDYIPDPQVLFMAVGDATCDKSPLQVGQFESGVEMEEHLSKFHLEGGGGGQNTESYELGAFIGARKTSIDCFEKRGRKGYFFFIGDEHAYAQVSRDQVNRLVGGALEADISTPQIFKELKEKYNVFFIIPTHASNGNSHSLAKHWEDLVGKENVLKLEDETGVAELIASQIGLCEGTADVDSIVTDLKDAGTDKALVKVVAGSVSRAYAGGAISKVAAGTLEASGSSADVKRL